MQSPKGASNPDFDPSTPHPEDRDGHDLRRRDKWADAKRRLRTLTRLRKADLTELMQLPWDEHFHEIVVPAWQAYLASEAALTAANAESSSARYVALREAGAASFYVHHFGDIVLRARPHWLPDHISSLRALREWLAPNCTALRTTTVIDDIGLLGDVADALKHAVLTRRADERQVLANEAVLVSTTGYGGGRFSEGKFGGAEQVLILSTDGPRALSAVLQNVIDAWRRAAEIYLPGIGEP